MEHYSAIKKNEIMMMEHECKREIVEGGKERMLGAANM
jgi:hypothetical protein